MCGFIGKISNENFDKNYLNELNQVIECRGPDSKKNIFQEKNKKYHQYIFNRLAILDLNQNADQPMVSEQFGNTIMFNGEIYNHKELKAYLVEKGALFNTSHSDTEVLLNGLSIDGMSFLNKLRGQFAIYFYNKSKNKAYLIRDRLGQKPLYYIFQNNELCFSSNLKSLKKYLNNKYTINEQGLYEYLSYGATTSPNTVINEIKKVEPATFIEFNFSENIEITNKTQYWKVNEFVDNKQFDKEEFIKILEESVQIRCFPDVPFANFLSGGLDSTTILKSMTKISHKINTFTIKNKNKSIDESIWAEEVAFKYETNHKTVNVDDYLNFSDVFEIINSLDEPFGDPSYIPTYIISEEMSKHYKVAISGDGGDELLGGYFRTSYSIKSPKNFILDLFAKLYFLYPSFLGTGNQFMKHNKKISVSYDSFLNDNKFLKFLKIKQSNKRKFPNKQNIKDLLIQDYQFYLPELMLYKIDRASMSNSLEVRSPFLDHKLIEYVLGHEFKYNANNRKSLFKEYISEDFSLQFINRKKQGFEFDLKNFVYDNLEEISKIIKTSKLNQFFSINNLKFLNIYKSRINANRYWRLLVLSIFLTD